MKLTEKRKIIVFIRDFALEFGFEKYFQLRKLGEEVYDLYQSHGLPPEISFDHMKEDYTDRELCIILNGFLKAKTGHRSQSGVSEKRLSDLQDRNAALLVGCIKGEDVFERLV